MLGGSPAQTTVFEIAHVRTHRYACNAQAPPAAAVLLNTIVVEKKIQGADGLDDALLGSEFEDEEEDSYEPIDPYLGYEQDGFVVVRFVLLCQLLSCFIRFMGRCTPCSRLPLLFAR